VRRAGPALVCPLEAPSVPAAAGSCKAAGARLPPPSACSCNDRQHLLLSRLSHSMAASHSCRPSSLEGQALNQGKQQGGKP
jgi:hypothetical protein